ncbi:hypothetical protein ASC94_05405 [Massilia sp. Root418]|uniref:hypothetical protein n=1 Tax=Massilia sp. Root418 TaxID=1736532 RepID=UPI0006F7FD94|nr:hypothetical protein [Massilia sp. Root418]KQX02011.1 hypothetical protein ASC94_05405 [Massilia sp. Root418]
MSVASVLGGALMCAAGAAQGALPDLKNMHDAEVMQNACKPAEQRRLQREAAALAGSEAPAQAARLVREVLCGTTPQSRAYVMAHTAAKVASTDEATGDTEPARPRMLPARSVQPAQMRAWSATVEQGDVGIRVVFYPDEGACIQSFSMACRRSEWKITAISQACD